MTGRVLLAPPSLATLALGLGLVLVLVLVLATTSLAAAAARLCSKHATEALCNPIKEAANDAFWRGIARGVARGVGHHGSARTVRRWGGGIWHSRHSNLSQHSFH